MTVFPALVLRRHVSTFADDENSRARYRDFGACAFEERTNPVYASRASLHLFTCHYADSPSLRGKKIKIRAFRVVTGRKRRVHTRFLAVSLRGNWETSGVHTDGAKDNAAKCQRTAVG